MDKEIKNRFENFEVKPPESVLNNLKQDLGFSKQTFLVKHKYSVAVSIIGAVIGMFILLNNNDTKTPTYNISENVQQTITNDDINNENVNINTANKENKIESIETEVETDDKVNNIEAKQEVKESQPVVVKNKKTKSGLFAGNDIIICGTQCEIGAGSNAKSGKWIETDGIKYADISNPKTNITSTNFGMYSIVWAEINDGMYTYDTISVKFKETPSNVVVNNTDEICGGSNATIEFVNAKGNYTFKWIDETITKPVRNNLSEGNYNVVVTNEEGCSSIYNININNVETIFADFFHTELYSAVGIPFYFTNKTSTTLANEDELNYMWTFGDGTSSTEQNPNHTYEKAGEYNVTLVVSNNESCSSVKQTLINVDEVLNPMPNIFTPNADGINDILVINPKPLANFKGMIFTRNGELVFEWDNQYEGWNGNMQNGEPAIEGVYYYVVTGVDNEGKKFQYRSFVHLNR